MAVATALRLLALLHLHSTAGGAGVINATGKGTMARPGLKAEVLRIIQPRDGVYSMDAGAVLWSGPPPAEGRL